MGSILIREGKVENSTIRVPCNNPAPLVVNGSLFVGCMLPRGHEGNHEVKISWER